MKDTKPRFFGLKADEVLTSRRENGENRLVPPPRVSFFRRMLSELGDPIIRVLLIALSVRILLSFGSVDWLEIGGILIAVLVSSGVSAASECGSERAFERLRASAGEARVLVIREGAQEYIPEAELVVGDLLILASGETVHADGVVLDGEILLELSALNGESRERRRVAGEAPEVLSLDDPHLVFSGSRVTGGRCICRVLRVGEKTLFGSLARELGAERRESPLKHRLTLLAGQISRIGYGAAALVAALCLFRGIFLLARFQFSLERVELLLAPQQLFFAGIQTGSAYSTVIRIVLGHGNLSLLTVVCEQNPIISRSIRCLR